MAKPKSERNRLFQEDWQKGLSNERLGEKYDLSLGGVKGLKARLRAKNPALYTREPSKEPSKVTSTQTSTSTKRMTFWLEGEMIEKVKNLARKQKRTASDIVRELFSQYLGK